MHNDKKIGKVLVMLSFIILGIVYVYDYVYHANMEMTGWFTWSTLFFISIPMLMIGLVFIIKNQK